MKFAEASSEVLVKQHTQVKANGWWDWNIGPAGPCDPGDFNQVAPQARRHIAGTGQIHTHTHTRARPRPRTRG